MKPSLADVDVVIPVRIDSADRLENLATVLAYFAAAFDGVRITVLEHDHAPLARTAAEHGGVRYEFLESPGCFHKSRVLNLGIALAERPYVLLYDCDVLFPPAALDEARRILASGEQDFVYPYNGILLEIARARVSSVRQNGGVADGADLLALLAELPQRIVDRSATLPAGVQFLHGTKEEPSSGAALMANRRSLLLAGGYNENIVSYGCEDTELATRLLRLGTRTQWLDGYSAYHVAHRRGGDSRYNNFHAQNLAEWNKVRAMDRAALAAYVRNGFRALRLDSHRSLTITNTPDEFSLRVSTPAKTPLDDVAFVLPAPPVSTAARAWVERLLVELDADYDNYELYLVEAGSYAFQSCAHRDHVLYVHATSLGENDCVHPIVRQTARGIVCLLSPLSDTTPATLLDVLEAVRAEPSRVAALPSRAPDGVAAARSGKLADVISKSLPLAGDALVFARAAYLDVAPAPSAERIDTADLRRRIEAAGAPTARTNVRAPGARTKVSAPLKPERK